MKNTNDNIRVNGYDTEEGRADSSKLPAAMPEREAFKQFVSLLPSVEEFTGEFPVDALPIVLRE